MNPDFGQYYEAREPGRRERAYGWATAIGFQPSTGSSRPFPRFWENPECGWRMASALNSLDKFRL